jgi:PAS domain S-box-containing protein
MTGSDEDDTKRLVEVAARLRILERLNRLVSSSLAIEDVLAAIARAASDIMEAPIVSFWLVDEVPRTVTVRAFSEPSLRNDFPLTTSRFGEGLVGRVAEDRRPFHVPDVFAPDSPILARDWFTRHGVSSFYGVPVLFQDHLLAVLALNGRAPFVLDEEDQELLASFVAQAAVAIRNATLFAEAQVRRRAAETAEARYRELFERSLAGILRTTAAGRILDCNDAFVRMLGYATREELMTHNVMNFYVDPAERAPVVAALKARQRLNNVEFRWRRADGTAATLLANVTVLTDSAEGLVLDGILIDITDRNRLEVAEREAEALRAVARLANAAAHEINNPLAVITGHLGLLGRRFADNPEVEARVEKTLTACRRISEMIAHMGRITRLEFSQQSPELPPILDLRRSSEAPPTAAGPPEGSG